MKILDKKGRVFGKINVVDLIVLLLVVCIIGALIWKVVDAKLTAHEEELAETASSFENAPHLVYTVVCRNILPEVAEACAAERPMTECQIMNNSMPVEAFITGCTYEPELESDGSDTGLCRVYITIEAALNETDGIYSVGTQEIRVGKSHIVKTYDLEITGTVISMEALDA